MWKFSEASVDDLKYFRNLDKGKTGIFSLYLDDGYDVALLQSLNEMKVNFDTGAEAKWHIMMPYSEGEITPDFIGDVKEYNTKLAKKMCEDFGIPPDIMPVLVFKEPDRDEIFFISMSRKPREVVIYYIRSIGGIIERPREKINEEDFRKEILLEIESFAKGENIISGFKVIPVLGSLARMALGG